MVLVTLIEIPKKIKLKTRQRISLKLLGNTEIGLLRRPSWSGSIPLYAFICKEHGLVASYPESHDEVLYCPYCIRGKYF